MATTTRRTRKNASTAATPAQADIEPTDTATTDTATEPTDTATNGWKVFHRGVANDDSQGPAAANYIKKVLNAQKVFVIDDQSAYGSGLADAVKKALGSLVVDSDKVTRNVTKDFAGT